MYPLSKPLSRLGQSGFLVDPLSELIFVAARKLSESFELYWVNNSILNGIENHSHIYYNRIYQNNMRGQGGNGDLGPDVLNLKFFGKGLLEICPTHPLTCP